MHTFPDFLNAKSSSLMCHKRNIKPFMIKFVMLLVIHSIPVYPVWMSGGAYFALR